MYLHKQDCAEWVIELNTATRNGLIQAAWTVQQRTDDQYTAYQLLYVTFLAHSKTILDKVKEGVGEFATQAWKDIWQSYMIKDAVESADLGNQMRLAKFFEGEFEVYIDTIVDLNIKLTSLNQVQPESQLVNEVFQHMLAWTMNHKESPSASAWSNFINTFNKDQADPAKYTLAALLETGRKAKEQDIQNAQVIAATLNKAVGKRKLAAMQASGGCDIVLSQPPDGVERLTRVRLVASSAKSWGIMPTSALSLLAVRQNLLKHNNEPAAQAGRGHVQDFWRGSKGMSSLLVNTDTKTSDTSQRVTIVWCEDPLASMQEEGFYPPQQSLSPMLQA
eukprot:2302905-Rhodomonas_salina.1